MLPNGAPEGSRHKFALKLCYDLLILLDGNAELTRHVLEQQQWVQDIISERGLAEIDRIMEASRKLLHKRESENFNDPQPSKEMRRAIKGLTGRDYGVLVREERAKATGQALATVTDILHTLERIGKELQKLAPQYPLLQLLLFRIKLKYFVAAFFVGGSFAINLLTRCWYRWYGKPGRQCRLNSLVMLIGRMGGGKHIAVDLYKLMMEPIKKSDAAQIAALNDWNKIKEQNDGGAKNKTPRPAGIYRAFACCTRWDGFMVYCAHARNQRRRRNGVHPPVVQLEVTYVSWENFAFRFPPADARPFAPGDSASTDLWLPAAALPESGRCEETATLVA